MPEGEEYVYIANTLQDDQITIEQDCACDIYTTPISPPTTLLVNLEYKKDNLFVDCIDDYYVVMNPEASASIVIMNQSSMDLLNKFENPAKITDVTSLSTRQSDAIEIIEKMAENSFILPVGAKKKVIENQPETLTAWLHLTNDCNLDCSYCYVNKNSEFMDLKTGLKSIETVVQSAKENKFNKVKFKYAGGEPTLNFELLVQLHRYALQIGQAASLDVRGVVLSNGIGLTTSMLQTIRDLNLNLMISLDGLEEFNDTQRFFVNGSGSFDAVRRSVVRILDVGISPMVSITLSKKNLAGIPNLVKFLLDSEIVFTLNFYRPKTLGQSIFMHEFEDDEIIKTLDQVYAIIGDNLPDYSLLGNLIDRANLNNLHTHACGVGSSYLVITHKGQISKCHMELETQLGNVYVSDPVNVIKKDSIGIRNLSVDEIKDCEKCDWRYVCAGGCPKITFEYTNHYDKRSPYCHIYKSIIPSVVRLEGKRLIKSYLQ